MQNPRKNQIKVVETQQGKEKQPFTEPKLTFVEPKLVKQGSVTDVTGSFMKTFSP